MSAYGKPISVAAPNGGKLMLGIKYMLVYGGFCDDCESTMNITRERSLMTL